MDNSGQPCPCHQPSATRLLAYLVLGKNISLCSREKCFEPIEKKQLPRPIVLL